MNHLVGSARWRVEENQGTRVHRTFLKAKIPSEIEITGILKTGVSGILRLAVPSVPVRLPPPAACVNFSPGQICGQWAKGFGEDTLGTRSRRSLRRSCLVSGRQEPSAPAM